MKTTDNLTVTNGRLKKALSTQVDPIIMPQVNKKINKVAKDSQIQTGVMTKFYPYLDKCEVKLNSGDIVICRILHRFAGDLIEFFTPLSSHEEYCEKLHEPCIVPLCGLNVCVLDVNDDTDEQIMIGYFISDDLVDIEPAEEGCLKLTTLTDTNEYWLKFGVNGVDIRSPEPPITNVGKFDEDMLNVDYATKDDLKDVVDLTEVYCRLDQLQDEIDNIDPGGDKDYVKKEDLIDPTKYDIDLNLSVGLSGLDDTITIDMDIVDHIVDKTINIGD